MKTEAGRLIETNSKREERTKIFVRAAKKTASVHSSPSSETPLLDISDDRTNEMDYSVTDSDKREW